MNCKVVILLFAMLALPLAVNAYTLAYEVINSTVIEGDSLHYIFTITNEKSYTDNIWLSYFIDENLFNIHSSASRVSLLAGENKSIDFYIDSTKDTPLLIEIPFTIYFSNPAGMNNEITLKGKFLKASNLRPIVTGYSFLDFVDPRQEQELIINVHNPTNMIIDSEVRYEILQYDVVLFNNSKNVLLEPLTTAKVFFKIGLEYGQLPEDYILRFRAYNKGYANEWNETEFKVISYYEYAVGSPVVEQNVFGKIIKLNITNVGTGEGVISVPINIAPIERFFNYYTDGDIVFENGKILLTATLNAGETASFVYKVTYIPLLLLPFILLGIYLIYVYATRKISISRKVVPLNLGEHSSTFKVTIKIKNISNATLKNVRVRDVMLPFIKKIGTYGTLHPKMIRDLTGKKLLWSVGEVAPKSEVIITYHFDTSLAILGRIFLPGTKVEYKHKGKVGSVRGKISLVSTGKK
ncbi:MAG: hypothetical protein GON13_02605 [Nanoarchaeota archaeon]|nr:hypothetical protein [Nanoarchaeota archaeon]